MYLITNNQDIIQNCYGEINAKQRCERMNGQYLTSTKQCKLSVAMCSSGYYVRAGSDNQSWTCDTGV